MPLVVDGARVIPTSVEAVPDRGLDRALATLDHGPQPLHPLITRVLHLCGVARDGRQAVGQGVGVQDQPGDPLDDLFELQLRFGPGLVAGAWVPPPVGGPAGRLPVNVPLRPSARPLRPSPAITVRGPGRVVVIRPGGSAHRDGSSPGRPVAGGCPGAQLAPWAGRRRGPSGGPTVHDPPERASAHRAPPRAGFPQRPQHGRVRHRSGSAGVPGPAVGCRPTRRRRPDRVLPGVCRGSLPGRHPRLGPGLGYGVGSVALLHFRLRTGAQPSVTGPFVAS